MGKIWTKGLASGASGNSIPFEGAHYMRLRPLLPAARWDGAKEAGDAAPFLFNKNWLSARVKHSPAFPPKTQRFLLMYVSGDRMAPTLKNDDLVLVDTAMRDIYIDKVYAVYLRETVTFCYIDALPEGWRLRFEDRACLPVAVDKFDAAIDMTARTAVMGMVVWSSRVLG